MATKTLISLGGETPVTAADIQSFLDIDSALYTANSTFFTSLIPAIRILMERVAGISIQRATYDLVVKMPWYRHAGFGKAINPLVSDPDKVNNGLDLRRWFFPIDALTSVKLFESSDDSDMTTLVLGTDYTYSSVVGNLIEWKDSLLNRFGQLNQEYVVVRVDVGPATAADFKSTYADVWTAFMIALKTNWEACECDNVTIPKESLAILAAYRRQC